MINTHRDYMWQVLRLFCKQDSFVEIKVHHQSHLLPKVHFNAQILLGLKMIGFFEDKNSILSQLSKIHLDEYLLAPTKEFLQETRQILGKSLNLTATKSDMSILDSMSDIGSYEAILHAKKIDKMNNLRYFLIKGIYSQKSAREITRGSALARAL